MAEDDRPETKTIHVHLWPSGSACYEYGCLAVFCLCITVVLLAWCDKLPW